ncbi:P-loop containing nucleoside triphosphate hydrolase protein [Tothia fuscella]|uniref:P-loop containing nucleoside triphosphate hydrolase protein n=1 Tax=Tothia fuscella TaxID=1048955 RepID=A0A9P4NFA2_9PEZI|nr:P-loop containing nucleoside triphosphate hydrolase protein [Tothia fuscella]
MVASITSFMALLGLLPLLVMEHSRAMRPPDDLVIYLLMSSMIDALNLILVESKHQHLAFIALSSCQCFLRLILALLESRGKVEKRLDGQHKRSPEETSGADRQTLDHSIPALDRRLSSAHLRHSFLQKWDQRTSPETKMTLPKVLSKSLKGPLISIVPSRLLLIIFTYAQPLLIRQVILFDQNDAPSEKGNNMGPLLIITSSIIYVGLATSIESIQSYGQRGLSWIDTDRTMNVQSTAYEDGQALNLMSTDVEKISATLEMIHETWAKLVEVMIGIILLAREIGSVWPTPLIMILLGSRVSRYVAQNLRIRQKNWNEATQNRVSVTNFILGSIKSVKVIGISSLIFDMVQNLRQQELRTAGKLRWMMFLYNASANTLGIFTPVVTIVFFAVKAHLSGSKLQPDVAFSTTAILLLVTHPANMIMTIIPQAFASFASFERLQNPPTAIQFAKVRIDSPHASQPILKSIDLEIASGSFVICAGPVGSGRTTLGKAILGEIAPTSGKISVMTKRIAYCSQNPWLPSTTVSKIIQGFPSQPYHDESLYKEVIRICCLEQDLHTFPANDNTVVGSRGINLSGGQKQRLAFARALYANCDILILDDSFSALDGETESRIVENLLSSSGLLKRSGSTLFWITNSCTWSSLSMEIEAIDKIILRRASRGKDKQSLRVIPPPGASIVGNVSVSLDRATGDFALYKTGFYFKSAGVFNIFLLCTCTASYSFFFTYQQQWIKYGTAAGSNDMWFYAIGLFAMAGLALLSTWGTMWTSSMRITPQSGINLHTIILQRVLSAPLSFFSKTESGSILNRFSQDIELVDNDLPVAIMSLAAQIFKLLVQASLLFVAQRLLLVSLPLTVLIVYLVQKAYLGTSRRLRLIELESRSAIFSSFSETIAGVSTIRAFGWEHDAQKENSRCLEQSQPPFYLLLCLQRWLNIVLDLLVAGFAVAFVTLAVLLTDTRAGAVGVALNMVLIPMELWDEEAPGLPQNWPPKGAVRIDGVTAGYSQDSVALDDITMCIEGGQTIVLCGRTGSGKSSVILTLLNLIDLHSGSIIVDDVDLADLQPSLIRQRCFVTVPQDSLFLPDASLRVNLDPQQQASPQLIIQTLRRMRLWQHFCNHEGTSDGVDVVRRSDADHSESFEESTNILDLPLCSLAPLSEGQTQLFSFARALIQIHPLEQSTGSVLPPCRLIILLDEPTSSLDSNTEIVILDIIRKEFMEAGHAAVIVAHRLSVISRILRPGLDMVVVMGQGRIKKKGSAEECIMSDSMMEEN